MSGLVRLLLHCAKCGTARGVLLEDESQAEMLQTYWRCSTCRQVWLSDWKKNGEEKSSGDKPRRKKKTQGEASE